MRLFPEPADKNRRVLVIDDNRAIHDDFRKILSPATATAAALDVTEAAVFGGTADAIRRTEFEVDSAYQGQEGVLLAAKALEAGRPYAMAFVDVRMPPGWDGVETTGKLWELDPNLQVVLCTAYSDYSWGEMFAKLGQSDGLLILKKPFDGVEAFQLAHALTEKWWLHQQTRRKMEELESQVAERTRELQQTNHALQTEVVEHTRAEEALRESKQIIEGILNAIPVRVFWKDKNLVYLGCNAIFARDAGFADPKDIFGKDDYQMGWRDQAELYRAGDREIIQSGSAKFLIEEPQMTPEGKTITLLTSKIPLRGPTGEITGVLGTYLDITERKRAEEALRESEERFSGAFEYAPIGVALVSPDGHWLRVNRALCDLVGYSEAELLTRIFQDITHPEDLKADLENMRQLIAGEIRSYQMEKRYVHKRGHLVTVLLDVSLVRDGQGRPRYFISQIQDITERKRLEARLFQAQKMETVGRLAGGVAHEFNSLLTVIIGQNELLLGDLPAGSPLAHNATEISKAAARIATLTGQLLAYGSKQMLRPEILDLNSVLAGLERTLLHLLGRGADVRLAPAPGLKAVKADARQIEQVLINLTMNARDAMPHSGTLTLATANVTFDQESVDRDPEMKPGGYVMLAVTDTGTGISKAVMAHLFEPFFTTKDVGQGTGLGLATCYGIIKQSGGHISVQSEPGRGTTFKIYLPQVEPETKIPLPRLAAPDLPRGTETILLVEADPALRELAATLLSRLGYTVVAAANGLEALSVNPQRDSGQVDLLITAVVTPHMSGKELADRVRASYPRTRILFISASTGKAIDPQDVLNPGVALLQKPFTPSALAHKVREALDQPVAPNTSGCTTMSAEAKTIGN